MLLPKSSVWCMDHDALSSMCHASRTLQMPTAEQIEKAAVAASARLRQAKGKVAVLPIHGVIEQRMSAMRYWFGGASCDMIGDYIDALLAARDVEVIVLDIDSPGGSVYGVQEVSEKIHAARAVKPIHAVANSMMCSAAYWIGSAATSVAATPGADVGSVGVYSMHVDYSAQLEAEGIKVTIAKAGKFKAEMSPYEPLSPEAIDNWQESVDETYTAFVKAVAANRGIGIKEVRDNFGQGRSVSASKALAANMVDRIATLGDVLNKLTGSSSPGAASADGLTPSKVMRLRQDWRKMHAGPGQVPTVGT